MNTDTKSNENQLGEGAREGTGKIARLPREIREKLNWRLTNNEPGETLLAWLNSLPEVQAVLARDFAGKPITKQNLSEWRTRGFRNWQVRQECLDETRELMAVAGDVTTMVKGNVADHVATVLIMQYAAILSGWDGTVTEPFERRLRALRGLCRDILALRRVGLDALRSQRDAEPTDSVADLAVALAKNGQPASHHERPAATGGREVRKPAAESPNGRITAKPTAVKASPTKSNQTSPQWVMPAIDSPLADEFGMPAKSLVTLCPNKPSWVTQPLAWEALQKAAV